MNYDDASRHINKDFPKGSPQEFGGTHIALFLKWCFIQGWAGERHLNQKPEEVQNVIRGELSATEYLFLFCDGKLTDKDLNEQGNMFAAQYYGDNGAYLNDYDDNFGDLKYTHPESAHDFNLFSKILSSRLQSNELKKSNLWRRYFEFDDGNSFKFWEITLDGNNHTVRYGRVGNKGTTKTKVFENESEAKKNADRLIQSKIKKGYGEVSKPPEKLEQHKKDDTKIKQKKTGKIIETINDNIFIATSDFEKYELKVNFLQKTEEAYSGVLELMLTLVRSANRKKKYIHTIDFQFVFDHEETYLEGGLPKTPVNHFFCEAVKFGSLHKKMVNFFNLVAGKDYWYGEFGSGGKSIGLGMYVSAALALHERKYTSLLREWFRLLDWEHHSIQLEIIEPVFNKYKNKMTDLFMGVIVRSMLTYNSSNDLPVNVQNSILENEEFLFLFLKQVKVEMYHDQDLSYQHLLAGLFNEPGSCRIPSDPMFQELERIFDEIKDSRPIVIASMMDQLTEIELKRMVRSFCMNTVGDRIEQAIAAVKEIETNLECHHKDPSIPEKYANGLSRLSNLYIAANKIEEATRVVGKLKHIAESFNQHPLTQTYFSAFYQLFYYNFDQGDYDWAMDNIDELLLVADSDSQYADLYEKSILLLSKIVFGKTNRIRTEEGIGQGYYDYVSGKIGVIKQYYEFDHQEEEAHNLMHLINNFLIAAFDLGKIEEGVLVADTFQKFAHKNNYFFHSAACLYVADNQPEKALTQLELAKKHNYPLMDRIRNDQDLKPLFENDRFKAL